MPSERAETVSGGTAILLSAAAFLLYMVSGGMRCNMGLIVKALAAHVSLSYEEVSFVAAAGQLMYGVTQPLFGLLALKRSNGTVLSAGVLLMLSGLFLTPLAASQAALLVTLSLLFFSGTGAVCFGIIMGTISPLLGRDRAAIVSGILNAASGVGTSLLSPLIQRLQAGVGIAATLRLLCIPVAVLLPVVFWIAAAAGKYRAAPESAAPAAGAGERLGRALREGDYRRLMAGFATCGFHMCIIHTHIYSQIVSYGIPEETAALAYTAFGIMTMTGSVLCGVLCRRFPLRSVLGSLYGIRAVAVAVFLFLLPKTAAAVFCFIAVLGMTGDATVTPTSQIIARRFGAAELGLLFGITFVCHQVGAFLSSWLGGIFISRSGNYGAIWCIDIALCALAAAVSWRIRRE